MATNRRPAAASEAKCYSMEHAGRRRTFRLYVAGTKHGSLPLIVVLHGGGGSGDGMEWLTKDGFNRIADRDGAVVAYPDGIGKGWNDGRTDVRSESVSSQIDDIGFLRALPGAIGELTPVDVQRVYATGISNGGLMSYRLACDAADVYAAVAPVAANMSMELAPRCKPARPVPIMIINGTDDPIMPWAGGPVKVLFAKRGTVLSTQATVDRWRALGHCAALETDGDVIDAVADDGTSLVRHTAQCASHTTLILIEIRGGGHTWPEGQPYLGKWIVGRVSRELDANEEIWQFFRRYDRGLR